MKKSTQNISTDNPKCQKTKRIPTPLANPDQHASSMISSFHHSHSSTDSSSFQSSSNSSLPTHNSYRVISRIPSSAPSQNPSTSTSTDVQKAASNTVSFKSTRDPLTNKIVIKSVSRHKKDKKSVTCQSKSVIAEMPSTSRAPRTETTGNEQCLSETDTTQRPVPFTLPPLSLKSENTQQDKHLPELLKSKNLQKYVEESALKKSDEELLYLALRDHDYTLLMDFYKNQMEKKPKRTFIIPKKKRTAAAEAVDKSQKDCAKPNLDVEDMECSDIENEGSIIVEEKPSEKVMMERCYARKFTKRCKYIDQDLEELSAYKNYKESKCEMCLKIFDECESIVPTSPKLDIDNWCVHGCVSFGGLNTCSFWNEIDRVIRNVPPNAKKNDAASIKNNTSGIPDTKLASCSVSNFNLVKQENEQVPAEEAIDVNEFLFPVEPKSVPETSDTISISLDESKENMIDKVSTHILSPTKIGIKKNVRQRLNVEQDSGTTSGSRDETNKKLALSSEHEKSNRCSSSLNKNEAPSTSEYSMSHCRTRSVSPDGSRSCSSHLLSLENHHRKSSRQQKRKQSWSRSRSRSPSYQPVSSSRSQTKTKDNEKDDQRRVIFVGNIPDNFTEKQLRAIYGPYGELEKITLHFRKKRDNFSFLTFKNSQDAHRCLEAEEKKDSPFDLCYGGRREFCRGKYADLDGMAVQQEEHGQIFHQQEKFSFDELLKQTKKECLSKRV